MRDVSSPDFNSGLAEWLTVMFCAGLAATSLMGQDNPAPPTPKIQINGAMDLESAFNPGGGGNSESLGYIKYFNEVRLSEATLSVTGNWTHIGFRVDGGGGDFYDDAVAADSWKGPNRYISQAYFIWRPSGKTQVNAGKFFSSVGAEAPQSYEDFNITRSLLFWYGEPLYHVGARATTEIGRGVSAGAQLLSGCNTIAGSRGRQTEAVTANWSGKRWGWSEIYMDGNEKREGSGRRHLSDTVLTFNPAKAITGYAEALATVEKRVSAGYDRWYGWATAWKYSPHPKWSVSPRVDWFDDVDGAATGMRQRLFEFTATGEYRPSKHVIARLEYRNDWSDEPFYQWKNNSPPSHFRRALMGSLVLRFHSEL